MTSLNTGGTFALGDHIVNRMGYGAMQLAGPGVFGPPKDRTTAISVLREALHPYPEDLVIVTKVGAKRGPDGSVHPAMSREEIRQAVHDNLRNLGLDALEVVNLRSMLRNDAPTEGSIEEPLTVLADLQREGLIRHIGLSNVTPAQVAEGRRINPIVCVQNLYNLVRRDDDGLIDDLAGDHIAYVPYFPLGGFRQLQSATLAAVARDLGATPMQVALAWLLQRSPNVLPIPGTASLDHLRENVAAATLELPLSAVHVLNDLASSRRDRDGFSALQGNFAPR